ncbi:hypothetical protein CBS147333_9075 [Penicillium roqueforti]|nr:hypothetical protein CBS147333_9075 [Penicillium roqueforti]KAI3196676.1 hypothetical protein CBS147311_7280 [Penicillium roqueforti]KAI3262393.1 hypothetical protein CBS147308_9194 [Penicillium roqueforti]KAI3281225.1 hypothetical protein DTO003C3_9032 [Penicillium roqueforti]
MPPHIYTEGLPEQPLPVPEWGHLPLDIYLLEQWDTPHPDTPNELPDQRRKRLVRQWLKLGAIGRQPYFNRTTRELATYAPAQPTQAEIETILRPLRPDSLRRYADYTCDEGMWVRTCYDTDNEEVRAAFWDQYVERSQVISADSLVFDDKELFEDADIARVLELFPERVTNPSTPENLAFAERELRKFFEEWFDDEEKESTFEKERELTAQGRGEEVARGYWSYQADCVVAHFFIEDAQAQTGEGLLHVFVDDCGNLVRKKRAKRDEVDNFDGAWLEGHWKEGWASNPDGGELGAAYLPGGVRGPPYNL